MPGFHVSLDLGCLGPLDDARHGVRCRNSGDRRGLGVDSPRRRRRRAGRRHRGAGHAAVLRRVRRAARCSRPATMTPRGATRPFDADRDGFVIGEGAGILVLESLEHAQARGARIYAEVLGEAQSADAYHIAQPDSRPDDGPARCMRWALAGCRRDAGRACSISTRTAAARSRTIRQRPPRSSACSAKHAYRVPISSTKSMIGHCIRRGGALEAIRDGDVGLQ